MNYYPTPFKDLNEIIGGFHSKSLIVLGARPAMGKSALMLSLLLGLAKNEVSCGVISFENSKERIAAKICGIEAEVDPHLILQKEYSGMEYQRIVNSQSVLNDLPINIYDSKEGLKIEEIIKKFKDIGVSIVFIDYLQLIPEFAEDRYAQISCCVQNLKLYAQKYEMTIFVNSQLSRKVDERPGHRPNLTDFRDSGCIEEAADLCISLLRREYYDPMDKPGMAQVEILKNRLGLVGCINLAFDKTICFFQNYEPLPFTKDINYLKRTKNMAFESL